MVDVSELVHQMHENLSAIHETISGLTTKSHDAQLTELEQKRDSLLDELRAMFDKEQEEVTAKRQAELDEIKEKRRIEDEERDARRKQEDEDLESKTNAEDLERHEKLDDDIRLIDEDTDKQMDEVEEAARKLIEDARLKLAELEQKRTEINRLIDEHLQSPLPEVPTRKRARADKSGEDDAAADEELPAAEEAPAAEEEPADAPVATEEEPVEISAAAEEEATDVPADAEDAAAESTALVEATLAEPVEAEEETAGEVAEITEDAKADAAELAADEAPADDADGEPTSMPDPSVVEEQSDNNDKAEAETPSLNSEEVPSTDAEQAEPVEAEPATEEEEVTGDDDQKEEDSVLSDVQPLMNNTTDSGIGLDPEVEAEKSQPASPSSGPRDLGNDADAEVPDLDESNGDGDAGNTDGLEEEVDESSKSSEPAAADETNEDLHTYSSESSNSCDEPTESSDSIPNEDNLGEEPPSEDAAKDEPEAVQADEAPAAEEEPLTKADEELADPGEDSGAHDLSHQLESDHPVEEAARQGSTEAAEESPEPKDVEDSQQPMSEESAEDMTEPEHTEPTQESSNPDDSESFHGLESEEPVADTAPEPTEPIGEGWESTDVEQSEAALHEGPVTADEPVESEDAGAPSPKVETVEADDKSELPTEPNHVDKPANEIADDIAEDVAPSSQQEPTTLIDTVPEETIQDVANDVNAETHLPSESENLAQPEEEQEGSEQPKETDVSLDEEDPAAAVEEKSIEDEGDNVVDADEGEEEQEAPAPVASDLAEDAAGQPESAVVPSDDQEISHIEGIEPETPEADVDAPVDADGNALAEVLVEAPGDAQVEAHVEAPVVEDISIPAADQHTGSEPGDEHLDAEVHETPSKMDESATESLAGDDISLCKDQGSTVEPDASIGVDDQSGQSLSETVIVTEQDDSSQDISGQTDDDIELEQSAAGSVLDEQVDQSWRKEPSRESPGYPTSDEEQQSETESRERGVERQEEEDSYSAQEREPVEPASEDHYSLPSYDEGDYPEYSVYADEILGDSLYSSSEHMPQGHPMNNNNLSGMDQSNDDASISQAADASSEHLSVDTSFRGAAHSPLPVENDTVQGEEDLFDDESASSHFSDEEDSEIIDSFAHEQRSIRDGYAQQSTPIQYDGASWGDVTEESLSEPYTAATTFQEPTPTQTTFNFANSFGIRMVNDTERESGDDAEPVKRSSTPTPLPSRIHGTAPDLSPYAMQSTSARSPNRGGLAASRHAPMTPTRRLEYTRGTDRGAELDPSLFVPRDVTHQSWHARNDSEPYSLRSQSTLSSGPPSPTHPTLVSNKLDPVIRDSWNGTADGVRSRASTNRNDDGDFDPFKYDSSKPTPFDINSPRRSFQSQQPTAESNRNSLTNGGSPMFQKLRSMFEAPSGSGSSSVQSSPTRSRPVSSIFATTGRERSTSQLRESHIPQDLSQSSVRSRYPNDQEDEIHEHSALLRDAADRTGH